MLIVFMHHIELLFLYFFFVLICSLPLVFLFDLFLSLFCLCSLFLSIMVRKTRAHRTSTSTPSPTFSSERFLSEKNQEAYEKLNLKSNIWAEREVLLDELDHEIRHNFERRGWLPLLGVDHPLLAQIVLFKPLCLLL